MNLIKKILNKIKEFKSKFKEKIIKKIDDFNKEEFWGKVMITFLLLLYIDISIFILRSTISYSYYMHEVKEWKNNLINNSVMKYVENEKFDNENKELENERLQFLKEFQKYENKDVIDFFELLNNEIIFSKVKQLNLYFNDNIVKGKVYFYYNKEIKTNSFPYESFRQQIEPKLISNDINFHWGTYDEHISLNETEKIVQKPFFDAPGFIIYPLIGQHIFLVLLMILILYSIEKQGGFGNSNKFELLLPENIKGSMDELIGMQDIKDEIIQLKDMIYNKEKYEKFGIDKTFNILFSGPPGTGKTKIASLLAKELKIPMVIGTGNIETGYVAGGANTLKTLFNNARKIALANENKTCIIFLDEAQVLLRKRGQSRDKWSDDSSNELLAQLDGVNTVDALNIIFIAASNFDDSNMEMDDAMERRFKKKIFFRIPNKEERIGIFNFYLNKINIEVKDAEINLDYIGEITARLSPAKIETIVEEASLMAVKENSKISTNLLVKSFERITVGMTTRKTTEKEEKVRKTVIYHELGHFVTDFDNKLEKFKDLEKVKKEITLLKISSESISKYNALGYVLNTNEEVALHTKKDLENDIISLYGGLAAEIHFLNNDNINTENITTGSYNDIEKVSKILKYMIIELGMYSNFKVNLNILDLKDDSNNIDTIKNIAERLFESALEKVKKHEKLVEFLYFELEKNWVLNKEELFNLINEFYENEKIKNNLSKIHLQKFNSNIKYLENESLLSEEENEELMDEWCVEIPNNKIEFDKKFNI